MATFWRRVLGAARLDVEVYEEVEADRGALPQAFAVVLLSALATGVGGIHNHGLEGVAAITLATLLGWYVWAWVAFVLGTKLLPGPETESDHGELLRTLGFSSAPGILRLLGLVEPLAGVVFLVTSVWMLVTMVVAVRQALDYAATGPALAVCAIGFPVYLLFLSVSLVLLGPWPV